MPVHCRMRAFDRDQIRGGHYGQRSCEPHLKAEHMAAPTNATGVKKALANSEPSTHGTYRTFHDVRFYAAIGTNADIERPIINPSYKRAPLYRQSATRRPRDFKPPNEQWAAMFTARKTQHLCW